MRKTLSSIILLLFACIQWQCSESDAKPPIEEKSRVIVLCDVSNSTTLLHSKDNAVGQLSNLKKYVGMIPKWELYPLGSDFFYYPVSDNLISEQLGTKVAYNIIRRSQLNPERERVDSLTTAINQEIDSLARNMKNSCILLSIKRAINRFNELARDNPGKNYSNELIIVSDMLECCRLSDTSEINMSVVSTARLNAAINTFQKDNPALDVKNLNLKVRVLINSPWMGSRFTTIQRSWEEWFSKLGVEKENLIVYTGEPDIKINPLFK